jgi:hypothetical protein
MSSRSTNAMPPAKDMDEQALGQTFTEKDFSADAMRRQMERTVVDRGLDDADREVAEAGRPSLQAISLAEKLHRYGIADAVDVSERYQVGNVIGLGATGRVYSVIDRNLNRAVALKVLAQSTASNAEVVHSFVNEAQITASLQHPNVLPVYDLDINEQGQIYFTTKKIDGRTLGDAIHLAAAGKPLPQLASRNAIISVFLNIGHALAYAHHKGIVHRDIKPDNIMLGDFGEVLLLDWGSAALINDSGKALYGTPIYMSPEQARREFADQRSDIYCLGASLFHALTLRRPTWANDQDEFWRKKRAGVIDPIDTALHRQIPSPLIDIMLKALAAKASQRYQSIDEFLTDLKNFQAGLAVSAHRDTLIERVARWHAVHARVIWASLLLAAVITSLCMVIYGEMLKGLASWGRPIMVENFDENWQDRWDQIEGKWTVDDNRVVLTADGGDSGVLLFERKIWGDTAIEFDGIIAPDTLPCDLSLFWYHDVPLAKDRNHYRKQSLFQGDETFSDENDRKNLLCFSENSYQACIGAKDGTCSIIEVAGQSVSFNYFRPQVGVRYHIRVEIEDATITSYVDGVQICRYVDENNITGGYFALYGWYAGKTFENVRIYNRGVAQKVSATAVPDDYFRSGDFGEAAKRYAQIAASNPGSQIGNEAAYKQGVCMVQLGRTEEAETLWRPLKGTTWNYAARMYRLEQRFIADEHETVLAELEDLYATATPEIRLRVPIRWMDFANRLVLRAEREGLRDTLQKYLDLHDRLFPTDISTDGACADMLIMQGRFEEVLRRYPNHIVACCRSLGYLGRDRDILDRYPDQPGQRMNAYLRMAAWDELIKEMPDAAGHPAYKYARDLVMKDSTLSPSDIFGDAKIYGWSLMNALGRSEQVVSIGNPIEQARALSFLGRFNELTYIGQQDDIVALMARRMARRALDLHGNDFSFAMWPRHLLGLHEFQRGDHAAAFRYFEMPADYEFHQQQFHLAHYVVVPFLRELDGDHGALERACDVFDRSRRYIYEQRPWYNAQFILGRVDDETFLDQPHCIYANADRELLSGIKLERAGKPDEALAHYRGFFAIPNYRRGWAPDPVIDDFVTWRINELSPGQ